MASAFRRISQSISGCSGLAEADKRRPSIHGQALECECHCDCPGGPCMKARKEAAFRREEDLSDYVIIDSFGECSNASSEDETIRLEIEGTGVCPITPQIEREAPFPWRIDLGERGWTGSAADGFSNDDHGRAEMLHYSDILRDLAEIDRTGTPESLANEATSMRAMSMTKSGFLRRRSLTPAGSNIQPYSHMGAWNEAAPPQAYLFSRQPPPSETTSGLNEECATGGRWDEGPEYPRYPRFIRDEDLV
ncbi:hypothetical protein IWX90DRAFT_258810 [Phyllosticta citrichinensis]|uniref:Uncharacterized protein n=1 Tax=Phyllosticta citrichinensis TaxID=1130410 RepID=A0ABR1XRX1_9PEZI